MSPLRHTVASLGISIMFTLITQSWPGALVCFFSGVLVDIDHVFDYCIAKRKIFFTYMGLYSFCGAEKSGKLYLIFHTYEFIFILWVFIIYLCLDVVWLGLAVGISTHILFDRLSNPLKPGVFFIWYRIKHKFQKKYIFPEKEYLKLK